MSPDATYSRVVEVEASATATVYPQVVFSNNPYGKLKITKTKCFGAVLFWAFFRLYYRAFLAGF
jgi:hypothetical protein